MKTHLACPSELELISTEEDTDSERGRLPLPTAVTGILYGMRMDMGVNAAASWTAARSEIAEHCENFIESNEMLWVQENTLLCKIKKKYMQQQHQQLFET